MILPSRRSLIKGAGALVTPALLLPRKSRAWTHGKGSGGGSYVAKAVHFDATASFIQASSPVINSSKVTLSTWFKVAAADLGAPAFNFLQCIDAGNTEIKSIALANGAAADAGFGYFSNNTANTFDIDSDDGAFVGDVWVHFYSYCDLAFAAGSRVGNLLTNGASKTNPANTTDIGVSFQAVVNGLTIELMSLIDRSGIGFDICDFQCWFGQTILPTTENLAKFASAGKPVDPATAALAFGQQTFLFSGDATGFPVNQGSGGAWSVAAGTITNASTSPSD